MNDLNPLRWTSAQRFALVIAIISGVLLGIIFPIPTEGAPEKENVNVRAVGATE
jgi:hypothetical protein